jgi:hypothetical protein
MNSSEAAAPDEGLVANFRSALSASTWHRALEPIVDEVAVFVDKKVQSSAAPAQVLVGEVERRLCRRQFETSPVRSWPGGARGVDGDRQRVLPTRCRRLRLTDLEHFRFAHQCTLALAIPSKRLGSRAPNHYRSDIRIPEDYLRGGEKTLSSTSK